MSLSPIAYAYGAGMLAAFNPCGFVLLPTYAAAFLADGAHGGFRAAVSTSLRITGGFFVVFAVLGAAVGGIGASVTGIGDLASWLGVLTGFLLLLAGAAMLLGRKMPGVQLHIGSGRGAFSYGMGYAAASLACALPVFLSAVVYVFESGGLFGGLMSGAAYAIGMGSVVSLVVLLTAAARRGAVGRLRTGMRYFTPVAGVLLVVAGAVLLLRRWVQVPLLENLSGDVVDVADKAVWVPAAAIALVAIAAVIRRKTSRRPTAPTTETQPVRTESPSSTKRSTT